MRSVVVVFPCYRLSIDSVHVGKAAYCIDVGDDADVSCRLGEQIVLRLALCRQQPAWSLYIAPNDSTSTPHPSNQHNRNRERDGDAKDGVLGTPARDVQSTVDLNRFPWLLGSRATSSRPSTT
jgi:hypothetical protein